ncbi:MAG: hypothetical protein V3R63_03470 [Alphaproteobacteria bacterium]
MIAAAHLLPSSVTTAQDSVQIPVSICFDDKSWDAAEKTRFLSSVVIAGL